LIATQQEVLQQTAAAFYDVFRFEARLAAFKENTEEHLKLVELIRRRVQLEASPDTDRVLAEARAQLAKSEEIQVNRQLEVLRLNLNQLVGSPVGPLRLPPPISLRPYGSDEAALKAASDFSPQRRGFMAQSDAAAAEVGIARGASLPTVVAGYQQNWAKANGASVTDGQGFVGLRYQSGSGLALLSAARAAESRRQAAIDNIVSIDRQLTSSVNSSLSEIRNLSNQLTPAKVVLQGTEEVVESYLRQYQIGRKGWLDVLNAQREKIQARAALADVTFNLESSKLRFMLLTGDITPNNLQSIHD
jgi:adhesin transport system outer membrane protein